jgi:hypothetical protein
MIVGTFDAMDEREFAAYDNGVVTVPEGYQQAGGLRNSQ